MSGSGPAPPVPPSPGNKSRLPRASASLHLEDPLCVGEVLLQERVLSGQLSVSVWAEAGSQVPLPPPTHIKGFTKGLMATKDRVRDGDQSWAGPFLPRGEVISSSIFCLERQVSCETLAALLAQIPHLPQPPAQLPGRQRSQSPWTGFGHESRGLRPPGQGRLQQPPRPPRPLPQAGPLGPPLPAANKESVRDLAAAAPSPLPTLPVHAQLTACGGASRGLARVWMMPLKARMSHTMTRLTTTAPGTCRETGVRPSDDQ